MRIITVLVIFAIASLVILPSLFRKSEAQAELVINNVVNVFYVVAYDVFLGSV